MPDRHDEQSENRWNPEQERLRGRPGKARDEANFETSVSEASQGDASADDVFDEDLEPTRPRQSER